VQAAVDWFCREKGHAPVGVMGYGEGGLLALYGAALDPRIRGVAISGSYGSRSQAWGEPIYLNVWGLLPAVHDAELTFLLGGRPLLVEVSKGPELSGPPASRAGRAGAAPGRLAATDMKIVAAGTDRAAEILRQLQPVFGVQAIMANSSLLLGGTGIG